jgi:membrane fusion protein, heavy metal efflux system
MQIKMIFGICLLAATVVCSCTESSKKSEVKVKYVIPPDLLSTLKFDTVKLLPVVNELPLTGMVDFDQDKQVNVFSLVSGNIEGITVQVGDHVSAGQVLAVVKSTEMAGYSNNLVIAQTNLTAMKKQLDATNELYKSGLASVLDQTNAQVNYDQALSQLETAKKILKINSNGANGEYVIKSPVSGYIVQKNVTNNTLVRPDNGTNLFTISDLKDVWVQANVYEANIDQVHIGDKAAVKILSEPDRVFYGKADKILESLDPSSKVMKVRIVLDNPGCILKPQMYASVTITSQLLTTAMCIPFSALVYDASKYYVLKYKGNGAADITPVEVLNTTEGKAYISSGLRQGDIIVGTNCLQIFNELNN